MGRIGTNASRTWNDSLRKLKAVSQPSRGRLNRFPRRCRHCSSQTVSRQQLQRALHRIRPAPRDKLVRSNAPSNAPRNRCPCTTCTWSAFASHLKRRKPRWNLYPTLTMPTHREPRWWQSPVLNPLRDSLSVDFIRVIMRERHLVIGITDGVVPSVRTHLDGDLEPQ